MSCQLIRNILRSTYTATRERKGLHRLMVSFGFVVSISTPPAASALEQPLIETFKSKVVQQVCSDGGAWLSCYALKPAECPTIISSIVSGCADSVFGPVSTAMTPEQGVKVAGQFQSCFNSTLSNKYGSRKKASPECAGTPEHMKDKEKRLPSF